MDVDLLIRGGTIVDGSGGEAVEGDVAISGKHIVAVGKNLGARGKEEIDAKGKIVTIPMEQSKQPIANVSADVSSMNHAAN